jgi:hypothetical protein
MDRGGVGTVAREGPSPAGSPITPRSWASPPQRLEAIKAAEEAARPEMDRLFKALIARREALGAPVDGILTAEQRTKLQQMRGAMGGKRGHRGHEGPPEASPPTR